MGLLQSSASLVYFGANTFLPDYLHAIGQPEVVAFALTSVNFAQIPAAPLVGILPWRLLVHPGTAVAAGGTTTLSARFVHHSLEHYLDQIHALAEMHDPTGES